MAILWNAPHQSECAGPVTRGRRIFSDATIAFIERLRDGDSEDSER